MSIEGLVSIHTESKYTSFYYDVFVKIKQGTSSESEIWDTI